MGKKKSTPKKKPVPHLSPKPEITHHLPQSADCFDPTTGTYFTKGATTSNLQALIELHERLRTDLTDRLRGYGASLMGTIKSHFGVLPEWFSEAQSDEDFILYGKVHHDVPGEVRYALMGLHAIGCLNESLNEFREIPPPVEIRFVHRHRPGAVDSAVPRPVRSWQERGTWCCQC